MHGAIMACRRCGLETVDVRLRDNDTQLCDLCVRDDLRTPTYQNQLWMARELLAHEGIEALRNPHALTGKICGCGSCFCCAAREVLAKEVTNGAFV